MTMFGAFLIAYIVVAAIAFAAYTPRLVGFFYAFRKPPYKKAVQKRKIGIIVPARNESAVIGDLLESIARQDYDGEFAVSIIVKDPDDPTIALGKKIGAQVYVVPDQTCKGDALDGFFKALPPDEFDSYDAFVIVDADGVLSPSYVRELNNALEWDYDIYLTRKYMKNGLGDRKKRTVFSNNSALTWAMLDDLGNRYRTTKDIPLTMCGQGMMLRRSLIRKLGGWPYRTLTEDYELRLDSVLKGFKSMYWPYAVLYTEEAPGHRDNYNRRVRWLTGYIQCDEKYKSQIKAQARQRGKINRAEYDCLYGVYPLALFAAISVFTVIAGIILSIGYALDGHSRLMLASIFFLIVMPFGILYVLLLLYNVLAMAASREAFAVLSRGEKAATLLVAPFYLLEYIPIYIVSFYRLKHKARLTWEQSERQHYDGAASHAGQAEPSERAADDADDAGDADDDAPQEEKRA